MKIGVPKERREFERRVAASPHPVWAEAALEDGGFSLSVLSEDGPAARVHFIVPAEFLSVWAPLIRTMFTTTILYKSRRPWARWTNLLVDEAGQLGKFKALLSAYTFGRGAGVAPVAFHDAGESR